MVNKTSSKKKTRKRTTRKSVSQKRIIEDLMENNVIIQKKSIELIESVNRLSNKIDTMVRLFEEAAKHIKAGVDEPLMEKLEGLLEQNKNIAKGLIMLEKYVKDKEMLKSVESRMGSKF